MAARPAWRGYLKIGLVNIPVKVFPATDGREVPNTDWEPWGIHDAKPRSSARRRTA